MNVPRLAKLATRLLRLSMPSMPTHPAREPFGDRAAAVIRLERALAGRARRRLLVRRGLVGAAIAAGLLLVPIAVTLTLRPTGVSATLVSPGHTTLVRNGSIVGHDQVDALRAGDEVHTAGDAATLTLSTGTSIRIAAGTEMQVLELGQRQRLGLRAGTVSAQVSKLEIDEEFSITTLDTVVSVRGTAFRAAVAPDPDCRGRLATHVHVSEGVVVVQGRAPGAKIWRLGPGDSWRTACPEPSPPASTPPAAHTPQPSRSLGALPRAAQSNEALRGSAPRTSVPSPASPARAPSPAAVPSTLAEQNELLARALAARQRGDIAGARRWLDALIEGFPRGPLLGPARRARGQLNETAP